MLIFVYFIIIFFFLPGGFRALNAQRGREGGFDVPTGDVCVLDPREIYAAGSGGSGWGGGTNQR